MNWIDTLIIVSLVIATVSGFASGLIRGALNLIFFLGAIVLAVGFHGVGTEIVKQWIKKPEAAEILGYLLIFSVTIMAGSAVTWIVVKALDLTGLRLVDRAAGALFGLLQACLVGILIVAAASASSIGLPSKALRESRLAPTFLEGSNVLMKIAPVTSRERFESTYKAIKTQWSEGAAVLDKLEKVRAQ